VNLFDIVVVQPIFNLLILIYSVIPGADFGIAIIILTIIIRFLMWPLVKKQLHQTKAMRKLQPELKRIKVKAKGNRQLEGMQMMELYKKHGINPFRSIGILLIQLPIFIALYQVIRIFTLHRDEIGKFTYGFLENIPIIQNLIANPATFNEKLLGFINLTEHAISSNGINIVLIALAAIAAATQFIVSRQTMPHEDSGKRLRDILAEAGEGKQPDQGEMNAVMMRKMMKFLPIMMFFIMINLPAALALYYTVSNILAALQQHYILKKDESEMEVIASEPKKQAAAVKKPTSTKSVAAKKTKNSSRDKISTGTTVTRIVAKDTTPRNKKS
jgi:YidC/Oxa1 family membrane protein insertase